VYGLLTAGVTHRAADISRRLLAPTIFTAMQSLADDVIRIDVLAIRWPLPPSGVLSGCTKVRQPEASLRVVGVDIGD
jgi:hypothetical protein